MNLTVRGCKSMGVLCVVDVQSHHLLGFSAAIGNNDLIAKISEEVANAMRRKDIIFIVEYNGYSITDKMITDQLRDYPWSHKHFTFKSRNDGSDDIVYILKTGGYSSIETERILVCGVNTHYCVKATAMGLAKQMPESSVIVLDNLSNDCHRNDSLADSLVNERFWRYNYRDKDNKKRLHISEFTPINLKTKTRRIV